jgi:hypothetical protein
VAESVEILLAAASLVISCLQLASDIRSNSREKLRAEMELKVKALLEDDKKAKELIDEILKELGK